jgi:molecular chaperone GrpE
MEKENFDDDFKMKNNDDDTELISKSEYDNSLNFDLDELKKTKKELEHFRNLYNDTLNKLKYSLADFDNYRKNIERQNVMKMLSIKSDLLLSIVNIREDFFRAIETVKQKQIINNDNEHDNSHDPLFQGLQSILKNIDGVLEKEGVKEIDSLNERFDPNLHEIIGFSYVDDNIEDNIVTKVIRKGYLLNDRVLRPSLVEVSKKIVKNIDNDNDNTKGDEVK